MGSVFSAIGDALGGIAGGLGSIGGSILGGVGSALGNVAGGMETILGGVGNALTGGKALPLLAMIAAPELAPELFAAGGMAGATALGASDAGLMLDATSGVESAMAGADAAGTIGAAEGMGAAGGLSGLGMDAGQLSTTFGAGGIGNALQIAMQQPLVSASDAAASAGFPSLSGALAKLGTGSMGLGPVSTGLNLYSGLSALQKSRQMQDYMQQLSRQADPFAASRGQYVNQLNNLMANPSSVSSMPGYQAGMDAVQRSMAAQGYQGSGNMMSALQQYGGQFYQQQLQNLMALSGAGATPGAGASAAMAGMSGAANLQSAGLAALAKGAAGMGV